MFALVLLVLGYKSTPSFLEYNIIVPTQLYGYSRQGSFGVGQGISMESEAP